MFGFLDGRHAVEDFFLVDAIAPMGIDGEIAHAEGGEVLEEMRTLRGIDVIVLQRRLHNHTRCGDMRPLHRDAEPGI